MGSHLRTKCWSGSSHNHGEMRKRTERENTTAFSIFDLDEKSVGESFGATLRGSLRRDGRWGPPSKSLIPNTNSEREGRERGRGKIDSSSMWNIITEIENNLCGSERNKVSLFFVCNVNVRREIMWENMSEYSRHARLQAQFNTITFVRVAPCRLSTRERNKRHFKRGHVVCVPRSRSVPILIQTSVCMSLTCEGNMHGILHNGLDLFLSAWV